MNIGDRIKLERERKGWTQDELALRCGYKHRSAISKIESSGDEVSSKKVRLMANVLGTTVSYLMGWEDEARFIRSSLEEKAKAMPDASFSVRLIIAQKCSAGKPFRIFYIPSGASVISALSAFSSPLAISCSGSPAGSWIRSRPVSGRMGLGPVPRSVVK